MKILYVFDNEQEYQDHLVRNINRQASGGGTPVRVSKGSKNDPEVPVAKLPEAVVETPAPDPVPSSGTCLKCKQEFQPKRKDSKFCSNTCAAQHYQQTFKNKTLREKLEKIKKTCPKPTERPEIQRQL